MEMDPRKGSYLYANRGQLRKRKRPLEGEAFTEREQRKWEQFHERLALDRKIAREERKRRRNERRQREMRETSEGEIERVREDIDWEGMDREGKNMEMAKDENRRRNSEKERNYHNGREKERRNEKRKSHSQDKQSNDEKKRRRGRKRN
ncbi:hypothetical protein niasHT_015014 [Heterodera trifolii]|uniref:Uncharacterized protein n=1 Tax=Heterodera trifolii TaxID=157864 RepID=A0ABD2L124_9BILA